MTHDLSSLILLDVREPWEFDIANIEGSVSIPLSNLTQSIEPIDKTAHVVCICHHGIRSYHAGQYLCQLGYTNVYNLQGGIDAWSLTVDPTVPRY